MIAKKIAVMAACMVLIAGCCVFDEGKPHDGLSASLDLVGFVPTDKVGFEGVLKRYQKIDPSIFHVDRYDNPGKIVDHWGDMTSEQIGCELLADVKFWVSNGSDKGGGTDGRGKTSYTTRIGMSCSTSCGGGHGTNSIKMIKELEPYIPSSGSGHRHHTHHNGD